MKIKSFSLVVAASAAVAGCQQTGAVVTGNGSTLARTGAITVLHGATQKLGFYASINPDCSSLGLPVGRVVTPPAHGEIRIVHEEGFAYFPPNNPRSRCNTQRVPGIRVIYQAAPDYRGPDAYAVEIFHVNGVLFRNAINVDVQ